MRAAYIKKRAGFIEFCDAERILKSSLETAMFEGIVFVSKSDLVQSCFFFLSEKDLKRMSAKNRGNFIIPSKFVGTKSGFTDFFVFFKNLFIF